MKAQRYALHLPDDAVWRPVGEPEESPALAAAVIAWDEIWQWLLFECQRRVDAAREAAKGTDEPVG